MLDVYSDLILSMYYICCQIYVGYLNYIPETNHVCTVYTYSVAAVLSLQFVLYVIFPMINVLYLYISTIVPLFAGVGNAYIMWSIVSSNFLNSLHLLSISVYGIYWQCVLFVVPDRMLLSFHFQFLSDLPSEIIIIIIMCC